MDIRMPAPCAGAGVMHAPLRLGEVLSRPACAGTRRSRSRRCPRLLAGAVARFGPRAGARVPRPHRSPMTSSAARPTGSAAAFVRGGHRRRRSRVALYLPNTPYHPSPSSARAKAGARLVHLSPLDAERELAHKLDGFRRPHRSSRPNVGGMAERAEALLEAGPARSPHRRRRRALRPRPGAPRARSRAGPGVTLSRPSPRARSRRRPGRRSRRTTSRCCNIPAARPACRRARS